MELFYLIVTLHLSFSFLPSPLPLSLNPLTPSFTRLSLLHPLPSSSIPIIPDSSDKSDLPFWEYSIDYDWSQFSLQMEGHI